MASERLQSFGPAKLSRVEFTFSNHVTTQSERGIEEAEEAYEGLMLGCITASAEAVGSQRRARIDGRPAVCGQRVATRQPPRLTAC